MKRMLLVFLVLMMSACGKSNEEYIAGVENLLNPILRDATTKSYVINYLEKQQYQYKETPKKSCHKSRYGKIIIDCLDPFYIQINIPIEEKFHLLKSTGLVFLFFDSEEILIEHKVMILHDGL